MSTDRDYHAFWVAGNRSRYARPKLVLQKHRDHSPPFISSKPELVKFWLPREVAFICAMIFGNHSAAILARLQGTKQTARRVEAKAAVDARQIPLNQCGDGPA